MSFNPFFAKKNNYLTRKKTSKNKKYETFEKQDKAVLELIDKKVDNLIHFFQSGLDDYLKAMMDYMIRDDKFRSKFEKFTEDCDHSLKEIKGWSHLIFEYNPQV